MKKEDIKKLYDATLKSGMFWEFFPQCCGRWERDMRKFIEAIINKQADIPANIAEISDEDLMKLL